jgi:hypothetical protein
MIIREEDRVEVDSEIIPFRNFSKPKPRQSNLLEVNME